MRQILLIADIYPFPFNTGGKQRTANLIIQLAKEYQIDFVCFSTDIVLEKQIDIAKQYCHTVEVFHEQAPSTAKKLFNMCTSCCTAELIVTCAAMQNCIDELLKSKPYCAIWIERIYVFQYVEHVNDVPVFLDMHDIEHEAMRYFGKISVSPIRKLYCRLEEEKIRRLEKSTFQVIKQLFTVSERDMESYKKEFPDLVDKCDYINNGIDMKNAESEPVVEKDKNMVVFVGSLRHPPNLHGVKWFLANVWKNIFEVNPKFRFKIIGSGEIAEEDKELLTGTAGVEFLGLVDNIYPILRKASCMVVPLFGGSGTRLKILEAFSFELPVVTTTVGAEGLLVENGKHLLICDTAEQMAAAVLEVMNSQRLSKQFAEAGYGLVRTQYSWENIGEKLRKTIATEAIK